MRYFLIILFMLAGLTGHGYAAGEQSAESGDSTSRPATPVPESDDDKKKPSGGDKKKPAEGEEEPDCE
jgi:hypothetical protein